MEQSENKVEELKLIEISDDHVGGDQNHNYSTKLNRIVTLREFIGWIFKNYPYEKGSICTRSLGNGNQTIMCFERGRVIKSIPNLNGLLNKNIDVTFYDGGWGSCHYSIIFV